MNKKRPTIRQISLDTQSMARTTAEAQSDIVVYFAGLVKLLTDKGIITEKELDHEAQEIQRQAEAGNDSTGENN